MTLWTDSAAAIHSALGEAVIYTPASGDPSVAIQAVRSAATQTAGIGFADVAKDATVWSVLRADIERPRAGDTITDAEGTVYRVQGEPVIDVERTAWTVDTHPL